jgi:hypothetical protein
VSIDNISEVFSEFLLPEQNLKQLTFCGHKPRQLQKWLEELPVTQTNHISVVLYKLLPEINHLEINGSQRIGLLGLLRPLVHTCVNGLADDFVKQSLSLSENTSKLAAIAQALQRHYCDGYLIAIKQLLETKKFSEQELSIAIYHAAYGLSQLLYRSYQLYIPRPPHLWKKLNLLYIIAKHYRLLKKAIPDPLLETKKSISCEHIYFRTLILACSNTNQLRQVDIQYLNRCLESWSSLVNFPKANTNDSHIYWLDLGSDEGPFYKSLHEGEIDEHIHAIDKQNLIDLLQSYNAHSEKSNPVIEEIPMHFRQSLITHLLTCWQKQLDRQQPRKEVNTDLEICIGLKAAHQHLLNGMSFSEFIPDDSHLDQITLEGNFSFNANMADTENEISPKYNVMATDISDNGYCLKWSDEVPPQVKSGELVLLREIGKEQWRMGTIRWAQRLNCHTYIGIQLMNGVVKATAVNTTLENGQLSPYFRAMLLKESGNDTKVTVITPTVPFEPLQQVKLYTEDKLESEIKLKELLLSSGSISQFSFRPV